MCAVSRFQAWKFFEFAPWTFFGSRIDLIFLKSLFSGSGNVLKTRRQHFSTPAATQIRAVSPFRVPKSSKFAPSVFSGFRFGC
jgi:hypothetical protein